MTEKQKKIREAPARKLQRSVFYWADFHDPPQAKTKAAFATTTAEEVAVQHGITVSEFTKYLDHEIESTDDFFSLPFTLLLVVSYALLAIAHTDATAVNSVEDSISFDIFENANFAFSSDFMGAKAVEDVNSHADFWSWMTRGFAPLIFPQTYLVAESRNLTDPDVQSLSEEFAREDRGFLLNFNRIILGVRMRQERYGDAAGDPTDLCGENVGGQSEGLQNVYGKDCVGGGGYDYRMDPETFQARVTTNPQRLEWLYVHDDYPVLIERLDQLEKALWLDVHTRKVEVSFAIFNAEFGIHCLFYCNFFFSRGGHIWKDIIGLTTFDFWFKNWYNYAYDCTWFSCLLYIIVMEGKEIIHVLKEYGVMGLKEHYIGFWNMVDWISVITGLVLIVMGYYTMILTDVINLKLEELGNITEVESPLDYQAKGKEYVEALEAGVHYYFYLKLMLSCYPMVIVMRLFKAFGAQPRLALVTNTLKEAQIDLLHFLLIVLTVFFSYMIAATTLFGREVKAFTTPFRSVITCFRAMMGDFDFPEMVDGVGRTDSFVWFFPFVLLIMLVLLNMLMAIIMDAYAEVVARIVGADTLVGQARKIYKRMMAQYHKELVGLVHVQSGLARHQKMLLIEKQAEKLDLQGMADLEEVSNHEELAEDEAPLIFVHDLKQIFPEMKAQQAKDLLIDAVNHYYDDNLSATPDLGGVMHLMCRIEGRTKKLKHKQHARESVEGLARNQPELALRLCQESWTEIDDARVDLGEWMPADATDEPLPESFMRPPAQQVNMVKPPAPLVLGAGPAPEMPPNFVLGGQRVPDVAEGYQAEVLANTELVMDACRRAGLDTKTDELRAAAVGRTVNVIERDDRDGTCRVHVPGVGLVWLAIAAFEARPRGPEITTSDAAKDSSEREQELRRELKMGRETVAEAMEAVKELQERVRVSREDKAKRVKRFQDLRHKAVALSKENLAQKQRLAQDTAKLRKTTVERDKFFDLAKALVEENQELEAQAQDRLYRRR